MLFTAKSTDTHPTVWQNLVRVPFVELHVQSLAMNQNANLWKLGKNSGPIFQSLCTKVREISSWCRGPLVVSNALPQLSISRLVPKTLAAKVALKLQSRRETSKIGGLGAPNFKKRISQILDMYFQIELSSEHVAGFG